MTDRQSPPFDLASTPIENLAKLLAANARRCECESGDPDPEVCVGPPDRWEVRWARGEAL